MKKMLIAGALFCCTTMFLAACNSGGGGDDHATQNENADIEGTTEMESDMSEDTTTISDTTTTM